MNKAAKAYFQTKVSTTDQGQLLLLLYDGALNYLQQARDKMLARDYAAKGILISKVIDIVNELSASLNMDKGGSLAVNLNNLYLLCTARLLQANLKMSVESLDSVVHILSGLRSAYAQIAETPEARRATAEIAGRMQPKAAQSRQHAAIPTVAAPTVVPRSQAQAAYGRTARQAGLSVLPPLAGGAGQAASAPAGLSGHGAPAAGPASPAMAPNNPAPQNPIPPMASPIMPQGQQTAAAPAAQAATAAETPARAQVQSFLPPSAPRLPNAYGKLRNNA